MAVTYEVVVFLSDAKNRTTHVLTTRPFNSKTETDEIAASIKNLVHENSRVRVFKNERNILQ